MFEGSAVAFLWVAINLGILMAIIAVITGRKMTDDLAVRPRAIYLAVVMLPLLVVGVVAAYAVVDAGVRLTLGPESTNPPFCSDPSFAASTDLTQLGCDTDASDPIVRLLVSSAIVAVISLGLYAVHLRWRRSLFSEPGFDGSAGSRVMQAFAYTVVLAFVVALAYAAYRAGYGVFRAASPSTSSLLSASESAEREQGIADLLAGAGLAAISWFLLTMHWRLADRLRRPQPASMPAAPEIPPPAP